MMPTDFEVKAAQQVFEQWLGEDLCLDIDSNESEWIVRKMLITAHVAVGDLSKEN